MTAQVGASYELLTRSIFQDLVDQSSAETIQVEHDIVLKGKTTSHQIDVYWKFRLGGVVYQTVVQAKDWADPVNQGQLILFKGVLDDLPGQPRGVFVTRSGYQEGAERFASAHGIVLYKLDEEPKAEPIQAVVGGWGRFNIVSDAGKFFIEYVGYDPAVEAVKFDVDAK